MNNLQDFLTLLATIVEYFFFAYLAGAFMVYSLKSPSATKQPRAATVAPKVWTRSVDSGASFAAMAGS